MTVVRNYYWGILIQEAHYKGSCLHRNMHEGPALIKWYKSGKIQEIKYYHEGKVYRQFVFGPAATYYRKDGSIELEVFIEHDVILKTIHH